jgi:mitogen-activated protein kinase kinase 7
MDLGVMIKSRTCPHIVKYLGAVGSDASVWIVMELMLCCFEKILKTTRLPVPVPVLGSLTYSVVSALNYLKEHHSTIHRDGKLTPARKVTNKLSTLISVKVVE